MIDPLSFALGTQSSMVAGQTPVSVTSSSGVKVTAQNTLSTDLQNAKLSPPQTQAEQAYRVYVCNKRVYVLVDRVYVCCFKQYLRMRSGLV